MSIAVWFLGMAIFKVPWTAYFDDYTVFSRDLLVDNTSKTIDALFDLLGIEIAREGSKASGFSKKFKTLGVEVNLEDFTFGTVQLGHTDDCREELHRALTEILDAGSVSAKMAESLRGRLHWFKSFAFGRVANRAVKAIGGISLRGSRIVSLSVEDVAAIRFLRDRVLAAPPIKLTPSSLRTWVVFTDGACEGVEGQKVGSVGGVLVSPEGTLLQFFGGTVPLTYMQLLLSSSKNPIYELEVLPVLMAVMLWGEMCALSQICWYLDNDAGRSAFIKAYGAFCFADGMLEEFTAFEMQLQIKSWFARVPSASNLADAPSRSEDSFLRDRGATKISFDWHRLDQRFVGWASKWGGIGNQTEPAPTARE